MGLKRLILQGESETLEFKSSLQLKDEIGKSVSSFLNSKGGVVLVGISDKREIKGVQVGKRTLVDLAEYVKRHTDPQVFPEMKIITIDNKKIILIKVKESGEKPVFFKNYAYKRVGDTNQKISASEIRKLAKEIPEKVYWDEQICEGASLEDIDKDKIEWFLKKAKFERRLDITSAISFREALGRLNLVKNSGLTNAAILLFGKNPQKFFLQAEIRCARFKGTEPLEFIDMKVLGGNIIDQREDTLEFVKEHIKLHAEIKGTERVERWEYPIAAVREAVTNAVCHRDYEVSSNTQVRIFDDRVEIWGCGPLPKPLTVKDLRKRHDSVLRNPLIGKCFFLIKYIEQWGTGTNRIIKECLNHGLPEPLFEELSGSLVVSFRKIYALEMLEELGLNERQIEAVECIKKQGNITNKGYQSLRPGVSRETLRKDLNDLIVKKIIVRRGQNKGVYYEFV